MATLILSARALDSLLGEWRTEHSAYHALAERIRLLILDGRIPVDSRLPAERELAARLAVSRSTVGAAYATLRELGFLASIRGSGSLARNPSDSADLHRDDDAWSGRGNSADNRDAPERRQGAPSTVPNAGRPDLLNFTQAALPAVAGLDLAIEAAAREIGPLLGTLGFEPHGLERLRQAIADRYTARGLPTHPDEIMVTNGALHALTLAARCFVSRGDRAVIETPTYPHAADTLLAAGARLVPVSVSADDGWDEDALFQAFTRTAPSIAYLMPDFQMPTGATMSPDLRGRVVEAALRSGTMLIADETTAELTIDRPNNADYRPLAAYGEAVMLGSASKTFWGGLRIGWVRARVAIIRRLIETRASNDIGTPVFEQLVAARMVQQTDAVLPIRQAELRLGRDTLRSALSEALPEWEFPATNGGLCVWVGLGRPVSSQLVLAARSRGLLLTAGPRFGIDGAFERYLRLPLTHSAAEVAVAVDVLQQSWREVDSRPLASAVASFADMI